MIMSITFYLKCILWNIMPQNLIFPDNCSSFVQHRLQIPTLTIGMIMIFALWLHQWLLEETEVFLDYILYSKLTFWALVCINLPLCFVTSLYSLISAQQRQRCNTSPTSPLVLCMLCTCWLLCLDIWPSLVRPITILYFFHHAHFNNNTSEFVVAFG